MQHIPLNNLIVIDIETVSEKQHFYELDAYWQTLWEDKVKRLLPEDVAVADFYEQRAGVMAEFSKIVCISMGYFKKTETNDWQLRIKSFCEDDEKKILEEFTVAIRKMEAVNPQWSFAGHNIKEFDIPFLCRRMLINGIKIPRSLDFQNMKPWETNIVDTFQYWRFGDYKNFTSLNLLAACLGVPSPKDDIDGSMVGKVFWEDKDCNRIAVYCQKDVVTVSNVILRFRNMPILTEEQIHIMPL